MTLKGLREIKHEYTELWAMVFLMENDHLPHTISWHKMVEGTFAAWERYYWKNLKYREKPEWQE